MKFGEVYAEKNCELAKLQFASDFLPFTFGQSLMKLAPVSNVIKHFTAAICCHGNTVILCCKSILPW